MHAARQKLQQGESRLRKDLLNGATSPDRSTKLPTKLIRLFEKPEIVLISTPKRKAYLPPAAGAEISQKEKSNLSQETLKMLDGIADHCARLASKNEELEVKIAEADRQGKLVTNRIGVAVGQIAAKTAATKAVIARS